MINQKNEGQTDNSDLTVSFVYGVQYTKLGHNCLLNVLLICLDIICIPYQTMSNCDIQSRFSQISAKTIHILFSYEGILITSSTLQHNHYAPVIRNHYSLLKPNWHNLLSIQQLCREERALDFGCYSNFKLPEIVYFFLYVP